MQHSNLQIRPDPEKITCIPTKKPLFDLLLRYFYNKQEVTCDSDNILDLIIEGYRYSLNQYVAELWSLFAENADAQMTIKALQIYEGKHRKAKMCNETALEE